MTYIDFKILVVDDDIEDLEIFCEAINEINPSIQCITARHGKEAIHVLHELDTLPDIIFLDHNMPQMNGRRCLTYIKSDERLKAIPVVMYSTYFSYEAMDQLQKEGAFVLKKHNKFTDITHHICNTLKSIYPSLEIK